MNDLNLPEPTPDQIPTIMPVIPLRDVVIFPYMIFPVLVGRDSSIRAVTDAIEQDKFIFVVAQRDPEEEDPGAEGLYGYGTVARILQVLKLPNGLMKVLVDGLYQARVRRYDGEKNYTRAEVAIVQRDVRSTTEVKALMRQLDSGFEAYVRAHREIPNESLLGYDNVDEPVRKLYYVSANLLVDIPTRQSILDMENVVRQYYHLIRIISDELAILRVEREIDEKVNDNIQRSQRKFYIQEQIRILQRELGDDEDFEVGESDELLQRITDSGMPDEVMTKALDELDKLKKTPMMSPEATVIRNYIDWLLAMPWNTFSEDNLSVQNARRVLNADHYGLEKPKERLLEHIAVLNLVAEMKGQILCFVGPPGVGKTSLGRSIARALNRKFARIALGGIHDEAEIRGHRRTYIGSMPGKIVQALRKAGTANPVILLDEIDKMSRDFQGDPTSAMLEVLDPEQNNTFNDHYLDVDVDLSKVMFITTANVQYNIPLPLQDRMEIIELPGYLEHEKLEIAKRHLVRKQIAEHGLEQFAVSFDDDALMKMIREYTQEAGVRNLERAIATACRKLAKEVVFALGGRATRKKAEAPSFAVTPARVEEFLGVPKFRGKDLVRTGKIGSVIGLAWTSVGGDILHVDVTAMKGQEKLTLTGQLGDVMKESAQAALSWLRTNAARLGIADDAFEHREIHIHLPEGAIPKDGPSAGLTMTMAMLSLLTARTPAADIAMTGEITLLGDVLAIGGLNEKLLAARRHGLVRVLIPKDNAKDLPEVPKKIRQGLKIIPVATIDDAIPHVFAVMGAKSRGTRTPPTRAK
ncbi:MAG: endopeptidase La [Bacteroidota bacterium]|jgi:ATP-dependent Lon protease|nr:endopeptidase La [Bacteroidota bacterium]